MPHFFINRPVFAWVIALFIILLGCLALPKLPIARYPSVAPTAISIYATYPGSTPQTMNDNVISLIERELSGAKDLLYFESSSDTTGSATITVTFKPGTDPRVAQMEIQNKVKIAEPRLPETVKQSGIQVESNSSNFLMFVTLRADNNSVSDMDLNDYFSRNILENLKRIDGVGRVQLFGAEKAMRVWINPSKLVQFNLTVDDIANAIKNQNGQVAPGRIGDQPTISGQELTYPLNVKGQLSTPEEFNRIILKSNNDGSNVFLADVARVEIGQQAYNFSVRQQGNSAAGAGVQLTPGANAVMTAEAIHQKLVEIRQTLPNGMQLDVPFDTTPFVKISIEKVIHTFIEAMILVFLVMYLFLQNVRYTLIPAIVAPIALLGTFTIMALSGFSINVLTMFGMVLAIGIIVDDAIVVVENVERIMSETGCSPKAATQQAMKEISGAVIGITLVLCAVFIPMALASGSVGVIYRQFTIAMAVSIFFSAFLALTLTPALCATLLKPVEKGHLNKKGFFGWFNRIFDAGSVRYENLVIKILKHSIRFILLYIVLGGVLFFGMNNHPSSFLPMEDQGYYVTSFQLPSDATLERTGKFAQKYERIVHEQQATKENISILGYSFAGAGPNSGMAYTMLKDWGEREEATSLSEASNVQELVSAIPGASVMSILPPAIEELGNSSGFTLRLEDRKNQGYKSLMDAQAKLLSLAASSEKLSEVYSDNLPAGAAFSIDIDRRKAEVLGVSYEAISSVLTSALGSSYINDFPNQGRMQQVIVQADAAYRMSVDDILKLYVKNSNGGMVSLSEFSKIRWEESPSQLIRYQGYPAVRIAGSAAEGFSSGAAMEEMENLAKQLPDGYVIEWTGLSLQEKESVSQAPLLMVLSMLVIFLILAALYESWTVPLSVMMVVPLGLIGCLAAVLIRELPNDVFYKVGMITIIGLSAKNAILIVEFAKQMHDNGMELKQAIITAAKLRLRPILMTSLAFTLGVVPLMLASGASHETQQAIGTGVFGGMVSATILSMVFVPIFYYLIMKLSYFIRKK